MPETFHMSNSDALPSTHSIFSFTTVPLPLSKPVLHTGRSSASSSNFRYSLFYWRSSSSCLHLILCLPVTSTLPSISPAVTCFRSYFLHKMWPIQLAFRLFIICRLFLSPLSSHTIGPTVLPYPTSVPCFKFPAVYETRRFVTSFTNACQLSLSLASSIQSIPHIPLPEYPP
jgi:hypothetical protein